MKLERKQVVFRVNVPENLFVPVSCTRMQSEVEVVRSTENMRPGRYYTHFVVLRLLATKPTKPSVT